MAFKMRSQSAVKKHGFKSMGSSPYLDKDPHTETDPPHGHSKLTKMEMSKAKKPVTGKTGATVSKTKEPVTGKTSKIYVSSDYNAGDLVSEDDLEAKFSQKGGSENFPQLSVQDYSAVKISEDGRPYVTKLK